MGEIASVDLDRLQALAERFRDVATDVDGLRVPGLDPAELPGAAVGRVAVGELVSPAVSALVRRLTEWASAACAAAESLRDADAGHGERFLPR